MAVALYDTDLTDITLSESITGWTALGGGASGLGTGADFSMQGTLCVDKPVSSALKGQIYNFGTTITPGTNTHFFIWVFLATPGVASVLSSGGLGVVLGTATTAYNTFYVEGSDTYGAVGRVGRCYPIRYVTTANTGSVPYRVLTGSPGANPQYFGATANITAAVKGANLGVDAMRYGTGMYITAGASGTPGTFLDASAQNDNVTYRWGILTNTGAGYELQGKFVVGQTKTYTVTAAYFADSNTTITLVDTPHSLTNFTQIIIDHASTVFNLTNVTVQALGTNNPGQLIYNNTSTVSALTGCTFVNTGITTLQAGVTASASIWRGAKQVSLNAATVTGCEFISSGDATGALLVTSTTDFANVSSCKFTNNTKAIKITTAGTYTFNGHIFAGNTYQVDFTGTGTCTINPTNGCNVTQGSCTATGGGTITVNAPSVTVSVTVVDSDNNPIVGNGTSTGARVAIYKASDMSAIVAATYTNASGVASGTFIYTGDTAIVIRVRLSTSGATRYFPVNTTGVITTTGYNNRITMVTDTIASA